MRLGMLLNSDCAEYLDGLYIHSSCPWVHGKSHFFFSQLVSACA